MSRSPRDIYLDGLTMGGALVMLLAVIKSRDTMLSLVIYSLLFLALSVGTFVRVRRMK
jgi:predicted lysophospholipase L1 biosynthesis ABC-type transport system permease subunit